jgi:hypothetical protein
MNTTEELHETYERERKTFALLVFGASATPRQLDAAWGRVKLAYRAWEAAKIREGTP